MPLDKGTMQKGFRKLWDEVPKDRVVLADKWSTIYDDYASKAITGNGGTIIAAGKKQAMRGVLFATLQTPIGIPAAVAAAWVAGMLAYWGGTPFTNGSTDDGPVPGVATPPTGASALLAALTAIYLKTDSADGFAAAQATALDTCTKTVMVAFGKVSVPVM